MWKVIWPNDTVLADKLEPLLFGRLDLVKVSFKSIAFEFWECRVFDVETNEHTIFVVCDDVIVYYSSGFADCQDTTSLVVSDVVGLD